MGDIRLMPIWKRNIAEPIHWAVYHAAVGMSDEEIEAIVKEALIQGRREQSQFLSPT